jgi:CelD/BcsL family acetyltransferase involved in cellulose biosynthesis
MSAQEVEALAFDEFARSEDAWTDLVGQSGAPYPFLLHPWLCTWWRHFGAGKELMVLVVRDGPRLVAAAPLVLRRSRVLGLSVAELAGTGPLSTKDAGLSDKADFLVRRDAEPVRELLVRELMRRLDRIDVLNIKPYDASSATCAVLERAAGRRVVTLQRSVSPFLTLPPSWEEYLTTRSPKFRKNQRRSLRDLEKLGPVSLTRLGPQDDARAWLAEVLDVDRESWTAQRGTNLYRHPAIRAFFLDLLPQLAQRGWLDLHLLRVGGRAVAYEMCLDFGDTLFAYNAGYRADHAGYSPGNLVSAAVVESACQRGRKTYDMLRGNEPYKQRWATGSRRELHTIVAADRLAAYAYVQLGIRARIRLGQVAVIARTKDRVNGLLAKLRH